MSSPVMVPSPAPTPAQALEARQLARWQRKLLPFVTSCLVVLAVAFFAITAYDLYAMRQFISVETTDSSARTVQDVLHNKLSQPTISSSDLMQQTLLMLEADAVQKRYRQASALLMSRIWTRQLAFMTGMVLAFIGALFILGKLSEAKSDVSFGAEQWKGAISSTSPGLILAFFGTVLMGIALVVQPKIEVQDRPLYFTMVGVMPNSKTQTPNPVGSTSSEDDGARNPFGDAPLDQTPPAK